MSTEKKAALNALAVTVGKVILNLTPIGENIVGCMTSDGVLLMAVQTDSTLRASQSGKSDTVATTGGNVAMGGIKIGVNAYRPVDKAVAMQRSHAEAIAKEQAKQNAA